MMSFWTAFCRLQGYSLLFSFNWLKVKTCSMIGLGRPLCRHNGWIPVFLVNLLGSEPAASVDSVVQSGWQPFAVESQKQQSRRPTRLGVMTGSGILTRNFQWRSR